MAVTLFGTTSVPVDNGTNATTLITLTPPASMIANDLVLVFMQQRGTATCSVTNAGGQSWTPIVATAFTNQSLTAFFTTFDGSWAANPSFTFSAGTCTTGLMLVFRPNTGKFLIPNLGYGVGNGWSQGTLITASTFTNGFGITSPAVDQLGLFIYNTADDNTWSLTTPNGYALVTPNQIRNLAGNDQSIAIPWKTSSSTAALGNFTLIQATLGADQTRGYSWHFYESDTPLSFSFDPYGMMGFYGM